MSDRASSATPQGHRRNARHGSPSMANIPVAVSAPPRAVQQQQAIRPPGMQGGTQTEIPTLPEQHPIAVAEEDDRFELEIRDYPPHIQERARQQRMDAVRIQQEHGKTLAEDCPILCWMLVLNRDYTREDYDMCWKVIREAGQPPKYDPESVESFRATITRMLPILMMRHRRIPRSKWKDKVSPNGKHWIEMLENDLTPEKFMFSMIGYHLSHHESLSGMAMTQGLQKKIVNIGMEVKEITMGLEGVPLAAYLESHSHKISPTELETMMKPELGEQRILQRVAILLALKGSYIKAIGQPLGFDYTRLEFDIDEERAYGDGNHLAGWEFRLFKNQIGVQRGEKIANEEYIAAIAFFRGTRGTTINWYPDSKDLDRWVQFITMDQMLKVADKLTA